MQPIPSRRQFIKTGGALTIAGSTSLLAAPDDTTCGIAIGTYGLQSLPLIDALQLISDTGYDAAEITVFPGMSGEPGKLTEAGRSAIRTLTNSTGMRICALMADLKPNSDDSKHAATTEELNRIIDLARDIAPESPPLIQTILAGKQWEDERDLFRDRLADWMQICADQKIQLSIKPHRGHAMSTPAHAAWLLKQLGNSRWLSMVYDASHYAFRDMPVEKTITEALPITKYIAVKDAVRQDSGKVTFALAGTSGNPDLSQIVSGFHKGGYRGDFCCEVSSLIWRKDPKYDPVAATKICYQNMVEAFQKAGVPRA